MKRGIATFTLGWGKCPPWLFERMVKLGRQMTEVLIAEYGPDEFIRRMADPVWFQSLGTVLAFDWNVSGLTTVLTGALKEAIRGKEKELGVFIAGGKGKTSLKTPDQIRQWGVNLQLSEEYTNNLVYNSKMSAKVDSSLIQDSYQIYHHTFFFSKNGAWTVVQQGMNTQNQTARRYHWFSESAKDLIEEPHTGIAAQLPQKEVLDMTSKESRGNRKLSLEISQGSYSAVMKDINLIRKHFDDLSRMVALKNKKGDELVFSELAGKEFHVHEVMLEDFNKSKYLEKIVSKIVEENPKTYEQLLATEGVGPKTIRALSLVSEVIYGAEPSYKDPARYSFAHGGKDATPYPVDRKTYDETIEVLKGAVRKSKIETLEQGKILGRLEANQLAMKDPKDFSVSPF